MDHEKEREENEQISYISIIFESAKFILGYAVLMVSYIYDITYHYDYDKGEILKFSIFPEINNEKENVTYD